MIYWEVHIVPGLGQVIALSRGGGYQWTPSLLKTELCLLFFNLIIMSIFVCFSPRCDLQVQKFKALLPLSLKLGFYTKRMLPPPIHPFETNPSMFATSLSVFPKYSMNQHLQKRVFWGSLWVQWPHLTLIKIQIIFYKAFRRWRSRPPTLSIKTYVKWLML